MARWLILGVLVPGLVLGVHSLRRLLIERSAQIFWLLRFFALRRDSGVCLAVLA